MSTPLLPNVDAGKWVEIGQATIDTLLMLGGALPLTLLIGLPLGILMSRSARVQSVLNPVLDVMQTMPSFVYLIPVLASVGYESHELDPDALSATTADRQGRDLLMRIGVSGFAMMNIMILSVAVWSGAESATRDLFHWISGAIALPTVFFAGQPFFRSAWAAIRVGRLGMDVPISLALFDGDYAAAARWLVVLAVVVGLGLLSRLLSRLVL